MFSILLIAWILVTFALATCLKFITKHDKVPPLACWVALFVSLLVFLPSFDFIALQGSVPAWLNTEAFAPINQFNQLTELASDKFEIELEPTLFALLASISLLRVCRLARRYKKAKRLLNAGVPYQHGDTQCLIFPTNHSPFVIGLVKPIIALPRFFLHMDVSAQATIIGHEQTHIQNRDHLTLWLWQLIQELAWFNPALITLKHQYINAIEQRCDEQTINALSLTPMDYANTLLTSFKLTQATTLNRTYAQFSSHSMALEDHKLRLTHIISQTPTRLRNTSLLLGLATLTVTLGSQIMRPLTTLGESWQYPVANIKISSHFGHVSDFRDRKAHAGVDLVDSKGSPILAAKSGKVLLADWTTLPSRYGKTIVIQHSDGWQSLYAHLDDFNVAPGQWVQQGEVIGRMGDTGKVTGTHLHFELAHQGEKYDPLAFLTRK